jgi:hypothetical protein
MLLKLGKRGTQMGYCLMLAPTMYGAPISNGDEAQELVVSLESKLKDALKQQIKHVARASGKKFVADKELIGEQEKALQLLKAVLPKITKGVVTALGGKKAQIHLLDPDKIAELSPQGLAQVLKDLAGSLKMLPPVENFEEWAQAIAPLLSFDAKSQELMTSLLAGWFDALLKNKEDLRKLAVILTNSKESQRGLAPLREKYKGIQHNLSQIMYPLVQVILVTHNGSPWERFLELTTANPQKLGVQLKKLLTLMRGILEEVNPDGATRADELLLSAVAIFFASDEFFALLGKNKAG